MHKNLSGTKCWCAVTSTHLSLITNALFQRRKAQRCEYKTGVATMCWSVESAKHFAEPHIGASQLVEE